MTLSLPTARALAAALVAGAAHAQSAGPAMRTSEPSEPTGPYTSTVQPDTSDLAGSTGASQTLPVGAPPPGVAPPNGSAPDTGGGTAADGPPGRPAGPPSP